MRYAMAWPGSMQKAYVFVGVIEYRYQQPDSADTAQPLLAPMTLLAKGSNPQLLVIEPQKLDRIASVAAAQSFVDALNRIPSNPRTS
jgi:hypothetical protein